MLPPVILMQMLSSPHFESHFGWATELPEFLGNPKDFSEKSWFYGTFPLGPLQGPPRLLRLLGPRIKGSAGRLRAAPGLLASRCTAAPGTTAVPAPSGAFKRIC